MEPRKSIPAEALALTKAGLQKEQRTKAGLQKKTKNRGRIAERVVADKGRIAKGNQFFLVSGQFAIKELKIFYNSKGWAPI